ncbi:2Fe-2S iron-sulfur cluster-binding protein [Plastoroseomonas hellenica]|uniref:2Fe-2S iron-sulfur cluster-binding protein n=1 Tax=Plastoroseomonas hellenica TaxID=2687306 RepID=UPI001BA5E13E|nr:pyridoxamine 5'-phosphate oxidase family protein [Plastoroseomonas hellenica]MBR0647225.1 2Fe-2S iron-sulfur cluster binding domain-containing protein [Plastoroseomonas hellenica]
MSAQTEQTVASPWHEGELAIQRSVGAAERMDGPGRRFIRRFMPEQHRLFYPMLPFIVLGAVDGNGDVWATMRAEKPGFMQAPDPQTLELRLPRDPADPADAGMEDGDAIGMLGIQLETRRRNRLNGSICRSSERAFTVQVDQSFGNCPRYIHLRDFAFARGPDVPPGRPAIQLDGLDWRARDMIAAADSFFVASYVDHGAGGRQVDVSHRGGKAGFVRIGPDDVLTIPDFDGNLFFNTLGNFVVNPKAGLLFVDFATGDMLQMTGRAEVILDSPEIAAFRGAERLWRFAPEKVVHRPAGMPLRWTFTEAGRSPNSLMTGSWREADDRLRAVALAGQWRPFRIARIVDESTTIRSLHLEPVDGAEVIAHQAGQHLPIQVTLPGEAEPRQRRYTLSAPASAGGYRISVKRLGLVSTHLHGFKEGDVIDVRAPAGGFTIDAAERRPAVLLAAGVGITPLIAMLRRVVDEGKRTRHMRPTWLFQSARTVGERPFDQEIAALVEAGEGKVRLVRTLSSPDGAVAGRDYDAAGHVDITLLQSHLPFGQYDFYLCGPAPFMQSLYDDLRGMDVADARIHAEAFGPSSLKRRADAGEEAALKVPASASVHVLFTESGKEARWEPGTGTLLELAEARGLSPDYNCRSGSCGTCRTPILEGAVTYRSKPSFPVAEGEALICSAIPAEDAAGKLHLSL